ncbi:MAG: phage protease [Comamonas sp.]
MPRSTHTAIAVLTAAATSSVAVAACAFALAGAEPDGDSGRILLQVTPAGEFGPSDGRPMDVPAWRIDAASAQRVIERFKARKKRTVIDYEHQTLHKEKNGRPALAAAWMQDLRWIEGKGLYAVAELTARAREHIAADEILYFSPVFQYSRADGTVLDVLMGAFTNDPAIHGMDPLTLAAATAYLPIHQQNHQPHHQEPSVNPLLKALLASLGLPESTPEEAATAALTALGPLPALKARADAAPKALGLADDATAEAVTAACSALRTAAAATAATTATTPDPAQYVPISVVQDLQTNVATLTAKQQQRDIDDLVAPALADGRLLPAQEVWARDLGQSNIAALSSYLATAQPIAALTGSQTGGRAPVQTKDANGLTPDELAVAAACGLTPAQFAAGKA